MTTTGWAAETVSDTFVRDWAMPIEVPFMALWNALDSASVALHQAIHTQNPPVDDLRRFSEEFAEAERSMWGLLLDALAAEPDDADDESSGRAAGQVEGTAQ